MIFLGNTCPDGLIPSDSANDCDTSCDTLTCDGQCRQPDRCVPGCVCPGNKVIGPNGQCIDRKDCACRLPMTNITLLNGESNLQNPLVIYTCKDGCIIPTNPNKTDCQWSAWTPYSSCSNPCNGTQSRFKTYTGLNCPNSTTKEDKQSCSSNCTVVCYQTADDGSVTTYKVGDTIAQTSCNRT